MKTLYIECNMGAAGDMIMSSLLELYDNQEAFFTKMNSLIPNVNLKEQLKKCCGIVGTHISVDVDGVEENEHMYDHHEHHHAESEHIHNHNEHHHAESEHIHNHHEHHHTSMADIKNLISKFDLPEKVKNDAVSVYELIAEAESKAHNCEIENIHFHEVGTMDAVADIVGVCLLINYLDVDNIISSPINVGKGTVKCAHGILPVPAPATAYILRDVPIYSNEVSGELCTPTGAALLKYFSSKFSSMPTMKVEKIGYGMGTKDFGTANCVRAFIGETEDKVDKVTELSCNIDDMSGERIAFAVNKLFKSGALDVYTTPIGMKKNRPAVLLTCICRGEDKEKLIHLIFKYTSTIGIRENTFNRYILDRKEEKIDTKYGEVRVKKSSGYGVSKMKVEYDDLERIALENDIDISEIKF